MSGREFYEWHVPLRPEDTLLAPEVSADFASGRRSRAVDPATMRPVGDETLTTAAMVEGFVRRLEARGGRVCGGHGFSLLYGDISLAPGLGQLGSSAGLRVRSRLPCAPGAALLSNCKPDGRGWAVFRGA